jgi:hypothetical protein
MNTSLARPKPLKAKPNELKGIKPQVATTDLGYFFTKIEFYPLDENLYIKLSGRHMKTRWNVISDFKQYTALHVIPSVDWGRHWEDGIYKLWKELDLDFGFFKKVLKTMTK